MKYFVIADVHGFYDEMIEALNKAGFDAENDNHMLVSLGDVFDRGKKPIEVIRFLNQLYIKGKAILIRGNHEDLLMEALYKGGPDYYDITNGTYATVIKLAEAAGGNPNMANVKGFGWRLITEIACENADFMEYMANTVDFFETPHYVFVHGWVPTKAAMIAVGNRFETKYVVLNNWRKANRKAWNEARWTNGSEASEQKAFIDKTIVCGHIHCSAWKADLSGTMEDYKPFYSRDVIALDACTAYSGFVNCVVLED